MASGEKTTDDITPQKVGVGEKQPRSERHEDELKPDSKLEATSKGGEVSCERSSLFLVKDSREYSKPYYQEFFRKRKLEVDVVGINKPANESCKDVIVEVETGSEKEVDMFKDLKSKASIMMSDTTTITLSGPYLPEIMTVISVLMENDPFLMGRGLHVDVSTTNMITKVDNIEDEQEQKSVEVSGPFRLVGYLRKLIHRTLVQCIDVVDNPQGKKILEIAEKVANESGGPDGGSDLDQPELNKEMDSTSTISSSKWEGEDFHHSANSDRHKSSAGTSGDDPPHGIPVATQTEATTQEATVLTGKKGSKVTISETIRGGNTSGGLHPNASTDHQNSNVGTSVDDTSVAAQTDTTTPKVTVPIGKESSTGAVSEATSKEPDVVEIPLSKTHRRLVVKKGHFLYEDADVKIAAICSEMGFTKGLNKNLNDQLKGQLQQTVNRRYQNGKPDKFDVFTVHCPPSTIGCRYLVVANILDRTLGSRQDHHKFLQQILHSVFKEADTLEMPTVAIAMQSFAIGGFPADTILPSFVRILDQYQFTNDDFFNDVRVLATSAENFSYLVAVSERFLGKSLTSRHTSSKKTAGDLPNSEDDKVHISSQGMIDKGERRVVPPLAHASNLNPAVIHLMIKCRMIGQFLTISSDFSRVDVLKGAERYLEDFSTSYQNLLNGKRIRQESVELRETLLHDMPALLLSKLEVQFPQAVFDFDVGKNAICFLSLDQSILEAVDKTIRDFLSEKRTVPKEYPHTNGTTEQPTITLQMPYNRSLTVKKGDLVKEEVTAIVNAANGWLKHEGGVAYAIDRASRGQVQRESDQVIRDNWQSPIPTGRVAVTKAGGDLRCKVVIHAVGPDARIMKIDNCKRVLKQACENTLRCAEDEGMHSIALPPISSGIYAMPKDLVAQILIDTILQYPNRQDSSLKDIRIVIIDVETFQPFLQYAQKVLDTSPFVSTSDSTFPPSSAPTYSATQKSSSPPPTSSIPTSEVDVVEIPLGTTHRRLVLKKSHFIYEDADIKIAAICSEMGFTEGLNKNLNDQLKDQLQKTVNRRYQNGKPDKFDVFTVHCSPSTICCRYLVVANILDRTLGSHQDHHKFLQQILHSVFKEADTLEMPSVAIVPTTFAIGGFPQDSILTSFIRMLRQYQFTNDEFLTDVRFIAATDVEFGQLLAVAERVSGTKFKVPLNVKTTGLEEQEQKSDQNQGSSFLSSLGSGLGSAVSVVTGFFSFGTNSTQGQPEVISIPLQADQRLTLKMGNLMEEDVDAIVNPANGNLKHVSGIASAINKASNGNVQRESDSLIGRIGGPISPGRVAVTAAGGKLHCKSIIHAVVPYSGQLSLGKYKELLEEACKNTLSIAEQDKMLSIAFPPFISSLDKKSQKGPIAQIFIDALLKYPYKHNSPLKDIRIVISDVETLQLFQQYIQQVEDSSPSLSSGASTSPQISTAPPSSTMHPSAAFPSSTHQQPSSPPTSSSIPTSKPEEVEIPFDKSHRKLIIKKGHFLYEDADIKIAAICSEMGFTKGLNKNLNDQLKGQLQQTVDRRYQNGKPDKFDVFTVHCPPSTIGCRYLVVANILDRASSSRQDHHKFLQQILHSVFKEADTLEMPSVAIIPNTFAISGSPKDIILPSFIRMFSQYQFTNDEFLTDVRFLATDDARLASLCAAAERTVGIACGLKQKSNPVTLAPKFSSSTDRSRGYGSKIAKLPVATVITGDIAQYAADAIVVPVRPSLDMKGATSKAINSISKGAVLKHVTSLKWKLSEGNVIPVPCVEQWNIQSKYLFFLCRHQNTTMEVLSQACKNSLEIAKSHHLQSIAFPPITSHHKNDLLAKAMMDVIKDFNDQNRGLLSVTIVVKKDDPIHKPFLQLMESTVSHWECKESAL